MTTRRSLLPLLLLALLWAAAPARAEDEPPLYGASDLAIEDEGLADGWEVSYDELEGTPGEDLVAWVMQIATGAGLDEDDLLAATRILEGPDGAAATILVKLGFERLEAGSLVGATAYGKGGRAIDPKAGAPIVLLGMVLTKEEKWKEAVEAFQAGFQESCTVKPVGRFAMRAYAHYGYACLQSDKPSVAKLGKDAFAKCVDLEGFATKLEEKFIQRYNYARILARLGKKRGALDELEMALTYHTKRFGKTPTKRMIENRIMQEKDLSSLFGDERFKSLIDKFTGGAGIGSGLEGL